MFLPPNVTNDQSGMSPLLAALSVAAPAPAPVPVGPAPSSPAGGALAAGGNVPVPPTAPAASSNPLSAIFGGSSSPTGSAVGNMLVNSGGHFLLPLIGRLMGGMTPAEQTLALKQRQDLTQAMGFQGLDEALQAANGNHNKALHAWLKTPAGLNFFANGGKMSDAKDYLNTASPEPGQEIANYEAILNGAGITGADARKIAYRIKAGTLKLMPRTSTNAVGETVATGQYDLVDAITGQSTLLGQQAAQTTGAPVPAAAASPSAPASAHTALTAPAPNAAAATSLVPPPPAGSGPHASATIAESAGPVGKAILAGGSLVSNVAPQWFPTETAKNLTTIDRIEAEAPALLATLKGSRGSNAVIKPLQELTKFDNAMSPQEMVQKLIAAHEWLDNAYAANTAVLANPAKHSKEALTAADAENIAIKNFIDVLPPLDTQTETARDGTKITVKGLRDELNDLHAASPSDSPVGKDIKGIPNTLKGYVEGGKGIYNDAMDAAGLSKPQAPGPLPKLKPGESVHYGNAIIKRLN